MGAEAISYYAERYGVSRDEAKRRMELQAKMPEVSQAMGADPETDFVQTWFDNDSGTLQVGVGPNASTARTGAVLEKLGIVSADSTIRSLRFDATALRQAVVNTTARYLDQIDSGDASVGLGAAQVRVQLSQDADTSVQRSSDADGVPIATDVSKRNSVAIPAAGCTKPYCTPVVAGVQYNPAGCTMAFYVGSPGALYNYLTAGHCITRPGQTAGNRWNTCTDTNPNNCPTGGYVIGGYYDANGDAAVLGVDTNVGNLFPGYISWNFGNVIRVTASADPQVGAIVCHDGRVTGTSCGTVASLGNSIPQTHDGVMRTVGNIVKVNDMCVNPGDSGGPLVWGNYSYAAGITNGGTCYNNYTPATFQPIGKALQQLGVQLYV